MAIPEIKLRKDLSVEDIASVYEAMLEMLSHVEDLQSLLLEALVEMEEVTGGEG